MKTFILASCVTNVLGVRELSAEETEEMLNHQLTTLSRAGGDREQAFKLAAKYTDELCDCQINASESDLSYARLLAEKVHSVLIKHEPKDSASAGLVRRKKLEEWAADALKSGGKAFIFDANKLSEDDADTVIGDHMRELCKAARNPDQAFKIAMEIADELISYDIPEPSRDFAGNLVHMVYEILAKRETDDAHRSQDDLRKWATETLEIDQLGGLQRAKVDLETRASNTKASTLGVLGAPFLETYLETCLANGARKQRVS